MNPNKPKNPKYLAKTFYGAFTQSRKTADELFNEWIVENPNVEIIYFRYAQARMGYHSIAILYKVNNYFNKEN